MSQETLVNLYPSGLVDTIPVDYFVEKRVELGGSSESMSTISGQSSENWTDKLPNRPAALLGFASEHPRASAKSLLKVLSNGLSLHNPTEMACLIAEAFPPDMQSGSVQIFRLAWLLRKSDQVSLTCASRTSRTEVHACVP